MKPYNITKEDRKRRSDFMKELNSKLSRKGINKSHKNGQWKGNTVGYSALHEWVKNRKPKPQTCENCHTVTPLDLANISQRYTRDLTDWEWLCRKCHMTKDGRRDKLICRNKS
jgi:hypothetical protein